MNTVFKVYYQAWTMLALASTFVVYYLACYIRRVNGLHKVLLQIALATFAVAVAAGLVYTLASSVSKSGGFAASPNLDGLAYLRSVDPNEYEAITWLQARVKGTPVILEAAGGSYTEFARVSSATGLPTVVGWDFHEMQWRGSYDEAGRRKSDVARIFETSNTELARQLLRSYGVAYVYVGRLERATYAESSLLKFDKIGDVVYRNPEVTIYKVRD